MSHCVMLTVICHLFVTIGVFNLVLSSPDDPKMDFAKVLEENLKATQSLVTKLTEMNEDSGQKIGEDAFQRCQKVTSEVGGCIT
jgi:hypothetical protein